MTTLPPSSAPPRWLIDPPTDGPTNMARDETILTSVGEGVSPPTLRFYRWDKPTISLGYFQQYADYTALPPPACTFDVVRRLTGGGAILHDIELTYSLTLPVGHPLLKTTGPNGLYDHVHAVFASLLSHHGIIVEKGPPGKGGCSHTGPFFCFERHSCFDLLVAGRKIMGSAQRRTTHAVLQHGSLILERRFDQQQCAAVSDFADFDINEHLPSLAKAILKGLGPEGGTLTMEEHELTTQLRTKYAGPDWTRKR